MWFDTVTNFVGTAPIIVVIPPVLLYLALRISRFSDSRELRLFCYSMPGVLLLIALLALSGGDYRFTLELSWPIYPSNIVSPIVAIYAIISYLYNYSNHRLTVRFRWRERIVVSLIIVSFLYTILGVWLFLNDPEA
jgi:hypothetical protein